jgi:hypothetical protein
MASYAPSCMAISLCLRGSPRRGNRHLLEIRRDCRWLRGPKPPRVSNLRGALNRNSRLQSTPNGLSESANAGIQPAAIARRSRGNVTPLALLPPVACEVIAAGIAKGAEAYAARGALTAPEFGLARTRQTPLSSEAAQQWCNAVAAAERSNCWGSRATMNAAAARLRRTMMPLEASLRQLAGVHRPGLPAPMVQSTPPAEANPEPQQARGPVDNQQNGSSVGGEKRAQPIAQQILPARVDRTIRLLSGTFYSDKGSELKVCPLGAVDQSF